MYSSHRSEVLSPGTPAPAFKLNGSEDRLISLADYRGQPAILVFYPADWSPVCGDQLALYSEIMPEFERFGAALLAISVDGRWCHKAYKDQRKLPFPLLADFEPKGEVSRAYNAYNPQEGFSARALYVVDSGGMIAWSYLSPVDVNPGANGILSALEEIASVRQ